MYDVKNSMQDYMHKIGTELLFADKNSERIKVIREDLGITQEKISRLLNLRRETVSRIENGSINPTVSFLRNFSRIIAEIKAFRDLYAVCELSGKPRGFAGILFKAHFPENSDEVEEIISLGSSSYEKKKARILKKL